MQKQPMHTAAVHHKMSRYFQSYIANNICQNGDTIHIATIYRHVAISINRDASYFLGFRRISAFMDSHMWRTSNRFQIHGSNLSYIRNNCSANCNKKSKYTQCFVHELNNHFLSFILTRYTIIIFVMRNNKF